MITIMWNVCQGCSLTLCLSPSSLSLCLTLPLGKVLELEYDLKNCANFSLTALLDTIKIRSFFKAWSFNTPKHKLRINIGNT